MRIIVDAFGGDNAPLEVIKGAAMAVAEYGHTVVLVGREEEIRRVAADKDIPLTGMEIVDAPDVISMEDEPKSILKEHKDCSMAEGMRRLAAGEGDAFVSAGSTGALIMGGTFIVKRIKGVSRAALAPLMPSDKGPFMLLDAGANADCRADMLLQFGHMGSSYMTKVMGGGKPATVGLLNVGTEDCKGGELQHEAFALLKDSGLNFLGNVEARDLPAGVADVVVADGFTGNVALKMMEGVADMMMKNIKGVFMSTPAGHQQAGHQGPRKFQGRGHQERHPGGGRICAGWGNRGYRGGGGEERGQGGISDRTREDTGWTRREKRTSRPR